MSLAPTSHATVSPDFINLRLGATTAPEALRELHGGLVGNAAVDDAELFLRQLLERHALGANCFSQEIAVPHARTTAVNRIVLAIGRSSTGVFFDEKNPSIRLVLLIGVPINAVTEYLRWMSNLARTLRSPLAKEALINAPDTEAFKTVCSLCIPQTKP